MIKEVDSFITQEKVNDDIGENQIRVRITLSDKIIKSGAAYVKYSLQWAEG